MSEQSLTSKPAEPTFHRPAVPGSIEDHEHQLRLLLMRDLRPLTLAEMQYHQGRIAEVSRKIDALKAVP